MKSLSLILFLLVVITINAQTRVVTREDEYLNLLTLKYKVHFGGDDTKYYTHTFLSGYEYPTIQQGYYSYGMFHRLDGLITFYTELANLENQEDGFYKLTTSVIGKGNIYVTSPQ